MALNPNHSLIVVLILLVGGGILVMLANPQGRATLSGVMEVVGDAQKTALKPAMIATRVTPQEEMDLGRNIAGYFGQDTATEPLRLQKARYVREVGQSLTGFVQRKEITYEFHLIDSSSINAFALPGGQIFVFTGLLDFVQTEAELATILGHEITHVDARHCIELFQAEMAAKKIASPIFGGGSWIAGIGAGFLSRVLQGGYSKFQEFEADAGGLRIAVAAGYDPTASEAVMKRLGERFNDGSTSSKAVDPIFEVAQAIHTAADSYFTSHPPSAERVAKLSNARDHLFLKGHEFYRGKSNLKSFMSRASLQDPEETFPWNQ